MNYSLKISKSQISNDLRALIANHESKKEDQNPEYPEYMAKFKSKMEIEDYFFYNHEDKTFLELHEYAEGGYGFYFNHKDGDRDSYQPIVKVKIPMDALNDQVINDIYKYLVRHIDFMNSLKK